MTTYWAIKYTHLNGVTYLDYMRIRSTRREVWREFDGQFRNATPMYKAELKRKRRNGMIRAVKVHITLA